MISPAGTVQLLMECSGARPIQVSFAVKGSDSLRNNVHKESLEHGNRMPMGPGCTLDRDPQLPRCLGSGSGTAPKCKWSFPTEHKLRLNYPRDQPIEADNACLWWWCSLTVDVKRLRDIMTLSSMVPLLGGDPFSLNPLRHKSTDRRQ